MIEYIDLLEGSRGNSFEQNERMTHLDKTTDPAITGVPNIWSSSLEDLVEEFKLESFKPVVQSISAMIKRKVFKSPREIELKLIYDGWVSFGALMTMSLLILSR